MPGKENTVADSLSRLKFQKAKMLAPELKDSPEVVFPPGSMC